MSDDDPKPVGELGTAFTSLTDDMPEASFTAWTVMGQARQRRERRRVIGIGVAAAAAGIAVLTPVIIAMSSNSSDSSSGLVASSSSARSSSAAAALEAPAPAAGSSSSSSSSAVGSTRSSSGVAGPESAAESFVGGKTTEADQQSDAGSGGSSSASGSTTAGASSAAGCAPALSTGQDDVVRSYLNGFEAADELCAADWTTVIDGTVGSRVYTATGLPSVPQVSVTLTDGSVDSCPDALLSGASCVDLTGHAGVRGASTANGSVVVVSRSSGSVIVSMQLGDPPVAAPVSLDQLAELATALAASR